MRCHFVLDEQSKKKVLIPGCYGSLHREDLSCCTCPKPIKSAKQLQNESDNKRIKELEADLDYLHKEYDKLLRIITRLKNKQCA